MSVTLREVAERAGVSIKTVSNVVNDYEYIRPETRRKVQDAIDALGYRPNLSARGLRSGRTGAISLIIPDLRNAYFAELADAVMRSADRRGLFVIIEQSGSTRERVLDILRGPRMQMVDGVLYSVLALTDDDLPLLSEVSTPMVLLGERIAQGPYDHVTMRNREASQMATRHLLDTGRRRIVALGVHPVEAVGPAGLRLAGYRDALDEAGLAFDPHLVVEVDDWFRSTGADGMRELLSRGVEFDGVVAFNDAMALGAMRVLQEAGLRLPGDVGMIGFDDLDESRYTLPALSSIDPGREEIAQVAVDYLVERIEARGDQPGPREHLSRFTLVPRESSAG
jgi:DNA-binding LacI/PurR family transcriptional regulator